MMLRKNSYAAKLIPTYGATPKAVVTRPRYRARTPPSSRMIFNVMPPIVRSALVYAGEAVLQLDEAKFEATAEEVWYAEASACFVCWKGIGVISAVEGLDVDAAEVREIDAVAIDSRDRTRSNGYVEQTEVMPANAPLANRFGVSNSFEPCLVNHFFNCSYAVNWTAL